MNLSRVKRTTRNFVNKEGKDMISPLSKSNYKFIILGLDSVNWANPNQKNQKLDT